MHAANLKIIAKVASPFKEKFGIPRQPRIAEAAIGRIILQGEFNDPAYIQDIEQHSHIWLLFLFHKNLDQGYKSSVRPPRLGGNSKTGVFATRSTFRPNGIGMSAVKLIGKTQINNQWQLIVQGIDLLDKTPIIDIKPYVPYSDLVLDAHSEMADEKPDNVLNVSFSSDCIGAIEPLSKKYPELLLLIEQVLQQDPRPSYKQGKPDEKVYGIRLYDLNIKWQVNGQVCCVIEITQE